MKKFLAAMAASTALVWAMDAAAQGGHWSERPRGEQRGEGRGDRSDGRGREDRGEGRGREDRGGDRRQYEAPPQAPPERRFNPAPQSDAPRGPGPRQWSAERGDGRRSDGPRIDGPRMDGPRGEGPRGEVRRGDGPQGGPGPRQWGDRGPGGGDWRDRPRRGVEGGAPQPALAGGPDGRGGRPDGWSGDDPRRDGPRGDGQRGDGRGRDWRPGDERYGDGRSGDTRGFAERGPRGDDRGPAHGGHWSGDRRGGEYRGPGVRGDDGRHGDDRRRYAEHRAPRYSAPPRAYYNYDRGWNDDWRRIPHGRYFHRDHGYYAWSYWGRPYRWYGDYHWRDWRRPWRVGYPFPRRYHYQDVPYGFYGYLPPPPRGCRYVYYNGDILLIAIASLIVIDAILQVDDDYGYDYGYYDDY
ncbi:MAG: hypothetical protein NW203_12735 [Hyphomonadaceae bacterium]|nr:hypothetical protein [Hyphomonadaceae bacterium]